MADAITITTNENGLQVTQNGETASFTGPDFIIDDVAIQEGGFSTITLTGLTSTVPVQISSRFPVGLNVSGGGPVTVNVPGAVNLTVSGNVPVTLNSLAGGNVTANAGSVTVNPSPVGSTVGLLAVGSAGQVTVNGVGASTRVFIGNNSDLSGVIGPVTIHRAAVVIDDSKDPKPQTYNIVADPSGLPYDLIGTGSRGNIQVSHTDLSSLTLQGGKGGNTWNVSDTPRVATSLSGGTGNDVMNVMGTTGRLAIQGTGGTESGTETVTIGNGSLLRIHGPVDIRNAQGWTDLIVDDSTDPTARNATLDSGGVRGLGGADLTFPAPGARGGVRSVKVLGGTGDDTFNVTNTSAHTSTHLITGAGTDIVTILATTGTFDVDGRLATGDTLRAVDGRVV
jgi:hypothetical protein